MISIELLGTEFKRKTGLSFEGALIAEVCDVAISQRSEASALSNAWLINPLASLRRILDVREVSLADLSYSFMRSIDEPCDLCIGAVSHAWILWTLAVVAS